MIEFRHIHKHYGAQQVLDDVSFTIADGARSCIVGGSGSGKSVMFRLMLGLELPDGGSFWLDGRNTGNFGLRDWHHYMREAGVVFQHAALFDSLTVYENVGLRFVETRAFPARVIRDKVAEALAQVRLGAEVMEKYPPQLSGGMQKRVAIARAVIHSPRYLFYDEPTAGLDPVSAEAVDSLIEQLSEDPGRSSVIITHDVVSVQRLAQQVLMLHGRQLYFEGTAPDFFASPLPHVREYLRRHPLSP